MSEAWVRFRKSMAAGFEQWHDGVGYDLDALPGMTAEERNSVSREIRMRLANAGRAPDWRDMEAADALGLTDCLEALREHGDAEVRLRAARYLGEADEVESALCEALRGEDASAASQALDSVSEYPSGRVRQAVIALLKRVDENFVNAGFVALEVFGGVADAMTERPFLFEVQEQGPDGPLMDRLIARVSGSGKSRD
ncbi:MAG: HEAT repeat domain-containing protein [Bryobacterales bacterium]|nr:HEAT repeat domain-containing protein [Bryobacterales bacterium]